MTAYSWYGHLLAINENDYMACVDIFTFYYIKFNVW